jgi:hypothetical protein
MPKLDEMVKACMQLNLSWEVRIWHVEFRMYFVAIYIGSESDKTRRKGVHELTKSVKGQRRCASMRILKRLKRQRPNGRVTSDTI